MTNPTKITISTKIVTTNPTNHHPSNIDATFVASPSLAAMMSGYSTPHPSCGGSTSLLRIISGTGL
jgi:hypothetical protein